MARTRSISNEQILAAARELFMEQGMEARTSEIAARANISEGTIFSRFKTKEALFIEAMEIPSPLDWLGSLGERVGEHTVYENAEWLANQMLDFFLELIPKLRMAMSQSIDVRKKLISQKSSPPVHLIKGVTSYFEREQRLGRLGACDPEILARALIGALHHHAFAELHGINDQLLMPRATYVRGILSLLIDNLLPEDALDPETG